MTHLRHATTLAAALAVAALAAPASALQPGEEIRMSVSYLRLPSGEGTISIGKPDDDGAWPLVFQGKTGGLAGLIDVREKLVTWWDPISQLPTGSNLNAIELGDRHDDEARFDRGSLKATVSITRKGRVRTHEIDVPADIIDMPSVLMFLRLQPLAPGTRYTLPVLAGRDVFQLEAEVAGTERLETAIGTVDTVVVRVKTGLKGKFDAKRDTWLWFTADERHVPVRISADFAVGSLVLAIKSYRPGGELAAR